MQHIQNILRAYHLAGAGEIDAGLRWYLQAHEEAIKLSSPSLAVTRVAAIIAALSPGLRWENNIEAARRIIAGEPLDGLGVRWYDGVRKAERILAGESPSVVLRGNKVIAFWGNIWHGNESNTVTIDGHAWAIWAGERRNLDEVPTLSDKLYSEISLDYSKAASIVGVRPCQLQAITWCTWRRLHNVASNHYLPLFEGA